MVELSGLSDEELIRLANKGSLNAFTVLYERHLPAVYNRVRYQVPEAHVEDVTQEVFITVMRSLKTFKGQAKFTTWLRTITNRRIADFYRKRERRAETVEIDELEIMEAESSHGEVGAEDRIVLQRAINSLSEHYQEILLLRFAEGLRFQEIAELRGQSLDATYSLFRRAISALREELGEMKYARQER